MPHSKAEQSKIQNYEKTIEIDRKFWGLDVHGFQFENVFKMRQYYYQAFRAVYQTLTDKDIILTYLIV